jgi:hypothetical protein
VAAGAGVVRGAALGDGLAPRLGHALTDPDGILLLGWMTASPARP